MTFLAQYTMAGSLSQEAYFQVSIYERLGQAVYILQHLVSCFVTCAQKYVGETCHYGEDVLN